MRDQFHNIIWGWMMDGMEGLNGRLERVTAWTKANGPLQPDEAATVQLMTQVQISRGCAQGDPTASGGGQNTQ